MKNIIMLLPMILLLQSCSSIGNKFDCPMKSGIRCESIDSINARVDRGEIGGESTTLINSKNDMSTNYKHSNYSYPSIYTNGQPLRYGETVMRVWFSPYEDKEGNYHQESEIYTITKPGHWIGSPVKMTENEDA